MTTEHTPTGLIGASIRRVEDRPLITGAGCFTEDIQLPGMLHMAFLRSPYPHAKIISIDTSAAKAMAGVITVVTGDDLGAELHVPAFPMVPGMKIPPHPLLARGAVHAAGTPVAAVIAQSRALAQDAANAIDVEYEALPPVVNAEKALEPGAPLAREELDSNLCYIATKKGGDVDKAFVEAEHIVRLRIASPRLVALAMEPRGIVAKPEPTGDLTVWLSTQSPHRVRTDLATAIGFPEHRIRVIAPDVGGGFGSKGLLYQEDALASHLALKLGRPVKWISTRSEDFVTTNQGRDQVMTSELAVKRDGTMLGLKVRVIGNLGAYLNSLSAIPPLRMMAMAPGCYQIQNCSVEVVAVFTNTVPTGPYRGAGRPESVLNIERLIDKAARELNIDCLEIRRKNFIRPEQFPYHTGVNVEYDSGDYEKSLAEALRLAEYEKLIRDRDEARQRGELVGVGLSTFVEPSGGVGFESATVRVERSGGITVLTGSSSHGQGHETVFAQVTAEKMRVSMDHVVIRHGDTLVVQHGVGTFGSRSAITGGGSLVIAADRVIEKARRIAAHLMEAAAEDIVQTDGGFAVAGVPEKKVSWRQIAAAAYGGNIPRGMEPGLQETAFFDPKREAWGFGAHLAVVRIDRET
ncbi:MAG TPA: xanthine dehydrogenase family protein molybdopterin-binding subunit, partial [Candidatus Binatia bacterium]|nr:xanthine dehydrogenase family protein molybdopterin-binding subunit [Candidatus Binatia bacterium]